ncbi:MAG TPA: hypothetical protein VHE79_14075, partial [Spirochaetia bacterium]
MSRRSLLLILVALLLSGVVAGLSAQAVGTDQQGGGQGQAAPSRSPVLTEGRVLSFDIGMGGGLPFNGGAVEVARYVAFDVNVSNAIAIGVADATLGGTSWVAFRLSYFILPNLGAAL